MYNYPRRIDFFCPLLDNEKNLFPAFAEKLRSAVTKTTMEMAAENILKITYPVDEIRQIRVVNIDDSILRIDIILIDDQQLLNRVCTFPKIKEWTPETIFHNERFTRLSMEKEPGILTVTLPPLGKVSFSRL